MRIVQTRSLCGPNVFATFPVLRMTLDLGDLAETNSAMVERFTDKLLAVLPGLGTHRCSRGYEGGFVERLREGTYPGHIIEHVALELSGPAGIDVTFGKTVYAGSPGQYHVVVEFENEAGMRHLLEGAVPLVEKLLRGGEVAPEEITRLIGEAKELVEDTALGPSTKAILRAATERGIPWQRLDDQSLVVLGYGRHRKFIQATTTAQTSTIAVEIASDKQLTKDLLERAAIPVPRGIVVREEEAAVAAFEDLRAPIVVKPLDGNQGKGVSLGIRTTDEVRRAFRIAKEFRSRVLLEEMVSGKNYRALIVNGKLVAASERMPAHVVGDGSRTIRELVEVENRRPERQPGHIGILSEIAIDDVVHEHLARTRKTLDSVPDAGEVVILREGANLSTGGTARDVTDRVHPITRTLCERAARAIDLDVCGIDVVMDDISRPLTEQGAVIELNAAPGIRMHEHPSSGEARAVGKAILESLYPPNAPSRIPIVTITGTNGKTTTTRMIAHVLGTTGKNVGMTSTDGITIGNVCVERGDTTGPHSARVVLFDPTVDVAVLETARGGIVRRGLGYDWSDVAVVTNLALDHLGQDGLETIEDLQRVKAVVAERVKPGGTLVLNAEDPHVLAMRDNRCVRKNAPNIVLFALNAACPALVAHVRAGGVGYAVRGGFIVELSGGGREQRIMRAADVPAAFDGTASWQVANAIGAIAACRALGLEREVVARGLARFDNASQNKGRLNVFALRGAHVVVDYGHNPASIAAVCQMATRWPHRRLTAVVSFPGDRSKELIAEAARAVAHGVDRIIVKEDRDRRGRPEGEVAAEAMHVVREEAPAAERIAILDEMAAIRHALATTEPGDVVILFTDAIDEVLDVVQKELGGTAVYDVHEATPPRSRPLGMAV